MTKAASSDLKAGSLAPDFSLKDEQGNSIQLSDLRGKPVLLFFYPGDLTPGCSMQLSAVRDDWTKFVELDVQVLAVNHAGSESHQAFKNKCSLPFPLLTDKGRKVSHLYGAVRSLLSIELIRRTVVGIDREGKILFYKHGMPRNADLLKAFAKLKK
jgi:thioredoxin-dependent peroxiredoxin